MFGTKSNVVRVHLPYPSHYSPGLDLSFGFADRLQYTGSDVSIYANKGLPAERPENWTLVLYSIMRHLFDDSSGVESVRATPFRLGISHSGAVSGQEIVDRVLADIQSLGFTPQTV